ncbi:uncharacterized protein LOC131596353 [Vicia villosa]|uniref:uncharacterized protein LOC131596353 n=1 Tax=Vicia villosa TaxID=3911 RepID=UPI00273AC238|nr:uncharacterized protein LOC131596353 [Vicia villosa]
MTDEVVEAVPKSVMDDVYTRAKVSVWWDLENWDVCKDLDPFKIKDNICSALAEMKYRGDVSIFCFGDTSIIPQDFQSALGIPINHVPAANKSEKDLRIVAGMLDWSFDNPPPANYLLISDNVQFTYAVMRLLEMRYNILLAISHQNAPERSLLGPAKIVWLCTSLFAGGSPIYIRESPIYTREFAGGSPIYIRGISNKLDTATGSDSEDSEVHAGN